MYRVSQRYRTKSARNNDFDNMFAAFKFYIQIRLLISSGKLSVNIVILTTF